MAQLILSDDELQATLILDEGEGLTPEVARALLADRGVKVGIRPAVIASLEGLTGPASLVVAEGEPAVAGVDARLSFLFRSGPTDMSPVIRPDGTADFRDRGTVEHVAAGQVLARREPPKPGRDGRSVRNRTLKARTGHDARLAAGEGAALTPDGLTVVAAREGNPHRRGNMVLVLPQYTVTGSVGLQTGHIQYQGDLVILGHVEPQMEVHATGSVAIRGNVEGARVVAGGSVTVEGGVRQQAQLEAGEDVKAKFIENATIRCQGSVGVLEDVVQCRIEAGVAVNVGGALVGGETFATERVEARWLGARFGTGTVIAVVPPALDDPERQAIEAEREAIQANLTRISPKIREAQEALAKPTVNVDLTVFRKVLELAGQLAERDAALAEQSLALVGPRARVAGVVAAREGCHPGVRVQVGVAHLHVRDALPACKLVEELGLISLQAYAPAHHPPA